MKRSTSVCKNRVVLCAQGQDYSFHSNGEKDIQYETASSSFPTKNSMSCFLRNIRGGSCSCTGCVVVCVQSELYDCRLKRGDDCSVSSASEQFVPYHKTTTKDFVEQLPCWRICTEPEENCSFFLKCWRMAIIYLCWQSPHVNYNDSGFVDLNPYLIKYLQLYSVINVKCESTVTSLASLGNANICPWFSCTHMHKCMYWKKEFG